jgi:hypothetical protein
MPRFALNLFSLRSEDNILSFSPQNAAHLIAKPPAAFAGGQAMESMENTRHQISLAARRA